LTGGEGDSWVGYVIVTYIMHQNLWNQKIRIA